MAGVYPRSGRHPRTSLEPPGPGLSRGDGPKAAEPGRRARERSAGSGSRADAGPLRSAASAARGDGWQRQRLSIGAITSFRNGQEVANLEAMAAAGSVTFSDDGSPVMNPCVMRQAMEICKKLDKAVLSHAEDGHLTHTGVMKEGVVSRDLNVPSTPAEAEEILIYREIALAELTGARMHILYVSTAGSAALIRQAQLRGVRVTGEACPHHFTLTDRHLRDRNTNFKMSPPLRTEKDVQAILLGLCDGTLDVIYRPLCITTLIKNDLLIWPELIEKLTINPARVLGIDRGTLKPGAMADVTIIDPAAVWTIDPNKLRSKSRNCPFAGWKVQGRADAVVVG